MLLSLELYELIGDVLLGGVDIGGCINLCIWM